MESLLSRISAYHIISYALTGLVLTACYAAIHSVSLEQDPIMLFGIVYLVGLLVSRVGSVLMEKPLKCARVIEYANYPDFVRAEQVDDKVSGLAEQSAFYRTLSCGFAILTIISCFDDRVPKSVPANGIIESVGYGAVSLLFLLAYRKQTKFVFDRVTTLTSDQANGRK